jgi:hypothetical protein
MPTDTASDLLALVNAIPTAQEGEIISSDYHNSLRSVLLEVVNRINSIPTTSTGPLIRSGQVLSREFESGRFPAGFEMLGEELFATGDITHGLGAVRVAIIIGAVPATDIIVRADRSEFYFALNNMANPRVTPQVFAAVPALNTGNFVLVASKDALDMFDRFRWWAIKA